MPKDGFTRAEKWFQENLLAQTLLKRSHLNEKTLKTLLFYHWEDGATFEEIARKLRIQQPGAWKRWQRGRDAIMRSFYTLELAIYAGILDAEIAELLAQDLRDYALLAGSKADLQTLRNRIEERMVRLGGLLHR